MQHMPTYAQPGPRSRMGCSLKSNTSQRKEGRKKGKERRREGGSKDNYELYTNSVQEGQAIQPKLRGQDEVIL